MSVLALMQQLQPSAFERLLVEQLLSYADCQQQELAPLLLLLWRAQQQGQLFGHIQKLSEMLAQLDKTQGGLSTAPTEIFANLPQQLPALLRANPRLCTDADLLQEQPALTPLVIYQQEDQQRIYLQVHWQQRQLFSRLLQARMQPPQAEENAHWGLPCSNEAVKFPEEYGQVETRPAMKAALQLLLRIFAQQRLILLVGGPGSGKTTTLVEFLRLLLRQAGSQASALRIVLAGPTGRAAGRMIESVNFAKANQPQDIDARLPRESSTLHRLLAFNQQGIAKRHQNYPLSCDLLVVDEASMINLRLFNQLLLALPRSTRLLLIGDADQLPPVEPGAVLQALLNMPGLQNSVVRLQGSNRMDAPIQQLANAIKEKNADLLRVLWGSPAEQIPQSNPATSTDDASRDAAGDAAVSCRPLPSSFRFCRYLERQYRKHLAQYLPAPQVKEFDPEQDWRPWLKNCFSLFECLSVLSTINRGPWGVETLNAQLDQRLGASHTDYHGRLIIITRNDHRNNLSNGDRGLLLKFAGQPHAFFPSPSSPYGYLSFALEKLHSYQAAWVQTIHRSQGSEFNQVEILFPETSNEVGRVKLLYTAITRARKKVRLYADYARIAQLLSSPFDGGEGSF